MPRARAAPVLSVAQAFARAQDGVAAHRKLGELLWQALLADQEAGWAELRRCVDLLLCAPQVRAAPRRRRPSLPGAWREAPAPGRAGSPHGPDALTSGPRRACTPSARCASWRPSRASGRPGARRRATRSWRTCWPTCSRSPRWAAARARARRLSGRPATAPGGAAQLFRRPQARARAPVSLRAEPAAAAAAQAPPTDQREAGKRASSGWQSERRRRLLAGCGRICGVRSRAQSRSSPVPPSGGRRQPRSGPAR